MQTYVIGDIQGCFDQLIELLKLVKFDETNDHLICAGDIINRGPKSLETIQYLSNLPNCTVTIGNHDLYLLRQFYINDVTFKNSDTINEIIESPDAQYLCEWLRHQPIMLYLKNSKTIVAHAGIYPHWNLNSTIKFAKELEHKLQSDTFTELLDEIFPNYPDVWSEDLNGIDRYNFFKSSFTLMRYVIDNTKLDFSNKCSPNKIKKEYVPWFKIKNHALDDHTIIFGHWSTLKGQTNIQQGVSGEVHLQLFD